MKRISRFFDHWLWLIAILVTIGLVIGNAWRVDIAGWGLAAGVSTIAAAERWLP